MTKRTSYFPWRRTYSINVKEMDNQHMVLVGFINDLQQALSEGAGREQLGGILDSLYVYTEKHFAAEEKLLKKNGYPGISEHCSKHGKMKEKVRSLIYDYNSGKTALPYTVLKFLEDWLIKHIQGTDKEYALYLNSKGIS